MFSRNTDDLKTMLPCEYEELRERGDDFRRALSHAVLHDLHTPAHWQVNAEYRTEFGGLFPVQCRFTPPDGQWHICVCSPGDISPAWAVVLLSSCGQCVRLLMTTLVFEPQAINTLLSQTAALARMRCSPASVAAMLTTEDAL
jgi:hypothetical protein